MDGTEWTLLFCLLARRLIKDFLWFFLYVLLLLGSCILAYFQISGGNTRFVTVQDALNSMALLTFGFMDYVSAVKECQL